MSSFVEIKELPAVAILFVLGLFVLLVGVLDSNPLAHGEPLTARAQIFCCAIGGAVWVFAAFLWWRERKWPQQTSPREAHGLPPQSKGPASAVTGDARSAAFELVNLGEVFPHLRKNLERARPRTQIQNIAFDMQDTAPWLIQALKDLPDVKNLSYKALAVDANVKLLQDISGTGSDISVSNVAPALVRLWKFVNDDSWKHELRARNVELEIRAYDLPPVLHGFMVNREHVYLGLTHFDQGKIRGSTDAYWYWPYDSAPSTEHLFDVYRSWFEYLWNRSHVIFQFSKTSASCPLAEGK